ncbi:MAG: hypothetical protein CMI00_14585 [Oceanospirillaceae bacterium]|nr:hypothetical protein [Oceanospirillaceae bacterium]|tara:strand:- start:1859 stop:2671 length:813 start_codon:yes stop_codon:yes gene_type:complete
MKFSERIGKSQVDTTLQTEGINDSLRNSIWNVLDIFLWSRNNFLYKQYDSGDIEEFSERLWFHYFKEPMDSRPDSAHEILKVIRKYYFTGIWYEIYDFLEYILITERNSKLISAINDILERELSGYRFIDSAFIPVTDEAEVEAVEKALTEGPFHGVHGHLKKAMEHLSRRENPDYRNSIKESISAVESMAKELTGNTKATLGDALAILEKQGNLHPALKKGFSSIYGYTSDQGGIRHAMLDEPNINVSDAKYFLVSCSSFINYLKASIK